MSLRIFSASWLTKLIGTSEVNTKINSNISTNTKTKFQKKVLGGSDSIGASSSSTVTGLGFSNLVIGKTYRISGTFSLTIQNNSTFLDEHNVTVYNAGVEILGVGNGRYLNSPYGFASKIGGTSIFTATSTTLTTIHSASSGNGTGVFNAGSSIILEELPNHETTTQWT